MTNTHSYQKKLTRIIRQVFTTVRVTVLSKHTTYNLSQYDMLLADDRFQLHTSSGKQLYELKTFHFCETHNAQEFILLSC